MPEKLQKNRTLSWNIGETSLSADISPCSWMYQDHKLQIKVTMNGGSDYYSSEKRYEDCTDQDFTDLCGQVKVVGCTHCGKPAFDPTVTKTNRAGECESCFMTKLNAEFAKEEKKEIAKVARRDKKMLAAGYTHRVTGWVHPGKGDDYMLEMFSIGEPSTSAIRANLNKAGSRVLDDYTVIDLKKAVLAEKSEAV